MKSGALVDKTSIFIFETWPAGEHVLDEQLRPWFESGDKDEPFRFDVSKVPTAPFRTPLFPADRICPSNKR